MVFDSLTGVDSVVFGYSDNGFYEIIYILF